MIETTTRYYKGTSKQATREFNADSPNLLHNGFKVRSTSWMSNGMSGGTVITALVVLVIALLFFGLVVGGIGGLIIAAGIMISSQPQGGVDGGL